jgi:hypothetical protein
MTSPQPAGDWTPRPDPTHLTTQQLLRELSSLRELLFSRLDAMDKATVLLSETVNRTPTIVQTEISHVRELVDEQFRNVQGQFTERDTRMTLASKAAQEALDAALAAAAKAAEKTEQNFTKQIDNALDRIGEIKERIDRGEGSAAGGETAGSNTRLNINALIAAAAVVVALVTLVLYATKR